MTHTEYYLSILFTFPEKAWFAPTNKTNEAYTICSQLAEAGLISVRRTPQVVHGCLHGIKHEFFYSKPI